MLVGIPLTAQTATPATDVQELLLECQAQGHPDELICNGYVVGAAEQMRIDGRLCPPKDVRIGAVIQVFMNWAVANPKLWGEGRSEGVAAALSAAWPCH